LFIFLIVSMALVSIAVGRFRLYWVVSESMEPTILVGDYLLVDGTVPVEPQRNDIVVVLNPSGKEGSLCKRIVGMPKDVIEFREGVLYVNGEKDPRSEKPYEEFVGVPLNRRWDLGPESVFVLGDNREWSFDSTEFGPVPLDTVLGIARLVYWPLDRIQTF
jgi:signal peptidase I